MTQKILLLMLAPLVFISTLDSAAQRAIAVESNKVYSKRCMDITVSYDAKGEISKVAITPNCPDSKNSFFDGLISDEDVFAVFDEYFPPGWRDEEVSRIHFSLGRSGGHTAYYSKVSVRLFGTCRDGVCGNHSATAKRESPKFPVRIILPQ